MIRFAKPLLCLLALLPFASAASAADQSVIDAARKEGALNVATAAPGDNFTKFMAAFSQKYPFLDISSGYFSAPTGRVLARVQAEQDAKRVTFDVMLAANAAAFMDMANKGRLALYNSPEYAAYPEGSKQDGYWASAQAIGVLPVYNKNILSPADAPTSWLDLLAPRFANGKLAIQNAAAGTQFNQTYLLEKALGADYEVRLAAQKPVVMATGAQMTDAIIRGEILMGASLDHWRAFGPDAEKVGLMAVYPREGTPLTMAPVGIVAGAPHPNAAKLFMDYILSKEGQELLDTKLYGMYSMRADVPPPPGQKTLADAHPLLPTDRDDYLKASAAFPQHFDALFH